MLLRLISPPDLRLGRMGCCLSPAMLLVPDGGALRLGYEGALAVLASLGGRPALAGNFLSQEPSTGYQIFSTSPSAASPTPVGRSC